MSDKNRDKINGSAKIQVDLYYKNKKELEGKTFYTYYGTPFVIKEYINCDNIIIEFPFSGITKKIKIDTEYRDKLYNSKLKKIDPFYNQIGKHCPFTFVNPEDELKGCIFTNTEGEKYKVLAYNSYYDCTIQFLDPPYYIKEHVVERYVRDGSVKDPYHKNLYGGFIGENKTYSNSNYTWLLNIWGSMLLRANNHEKFHDYTAVSGSINYAYDNCTVSKEWLEYSVFAKDYMEKLSKLNPNIKYELDKDLLYPFYKDKTNGMKLYSKETTVLLPADINRSFICLNPMKGFYRKYGYKDMHLYKKFKEKLEIQWKEKFQYYLNIGALTPEIYEILENLRKEKLKVLIDNHQEFET